MANRGRLCLRGQWPGALTVQLTVVGAGALLLVLEIAALRLSGMPVEQMVRVPDLLADGGLWKHALLIAGVAALDLFLVSPLRLGQSAYYYALTAGQEEPRGSTCPFSHVQTAASEADQSQTHEFKPVKTELPVRVPVRTIWRFYRKGYGRAVGWRAALWGWRTLYGIGCFAPATMLWGYSEAIRLGGDTAPLADVTRLFCGLFGLFALAAGWAVQQLLLFRYLPAQYLLAEGMPLRQAFRESRRRMKGRVGATAWLYMGFSGWLAACVLLVPFFYVSPLFLTTRAVYVRRLPQPAPQKEPIQKAKRVKRPAAVSKRHANRPVS